MGAFGWGCECVGVALVGEHLDAGLLHAGRVQCVTAWVGLRRRRFVHDVVRAALHVLDVLGCAEI